MALGVDLPHEFLAAKEALAGVHIKVQGVTFLFFGARQRVELLQLEDLRVEGGHFRLDILDLSELLSLVVR